MNQKSLLVLAIIELFFVLFRQCFILFVCGLVEREPALQRKHRQQTSSTKSQIFFPANPTTSAGKLSTSASKTTQSTSATSVQPSPSASVSTVPAGISSGAGSHKSSSNSNEYMLLGSQSKFAPNVVYHVRPSSSSSVVCAVTLQLFSE